MVIGRLVGKRQPSAIRADLLVLFLLPLLCAGQAARAEEPPYFAIRNARIVPVSGPVIKSGTVVIAKGVFVAVGENAPIPPEAWVVEGKGLTVYPGLINALTDVGLGSAVPPMGPGGAGGGPAAAPAAISRGPEDRPATTPWRNAADEVKPDDKRLETWRNAGFTTALATSLQGIFAGEGALVDLAGERPGEMVIKAPASLDLTLQPMGGFANFPDSLMGVLAYIKQVYLDTGWYGDAEAIFTAHPEGLKRPPYDRAEIAVLRASKSGLPVLIPANLDKEILRALDLAGQIQVHAVIYGGQQGYAVAEALAAKKTPVLVNLKWPEKEKDADPEADEPLRLLRFRDRAPSTPAALEKAGVKFAFYADSTVTPKDALKNAKKAVDAGLAEEAALRAFTLSAAEILGVADRLGSIEPGKIANLVVTDGDLFNEKSKVKMTFVDGQRYEVHEPSRPTEPPTVKLTGKWRISIPNTPEGPQELTADLTMAEDGTLTGSATGVSGSIMAGLGTVSISSGWVSTNRFSFTITLSIEGTPADLAFSGTVEGDEMKGTASTQGVSVDFTGSRPEARQNRATGWQD